MRNNYRWQYAKSALYYVKSKMQIGAANKLSDGVVVPNVCLSAQRNGILYAGSRFNELKWGIPKIRALAVASETSGCGNCGEQSAIAFMYLLRQNIRPLDYMHRTDGDHAFVVIGRSSGSEDAPAQTWGPDAVVCDPWRGEVVDSVAIADRHWRTKSDCRID